MYRNLFYGNEAFRIMWTVWAIFFFFLLNTTDKDVWSIIQGFNYSSKTAEILLKKK